MELLVQGAEELGIRLGCAEIDQFHRYSLEIESWNKRLNLTTVSGWEQVQTRHFLDSLVVGAVVPASVFRSGASVLDIGSGAGLPGLPLKIVFRAVKLTLLEATGKKTEFLTHVSRKLGLSDVDVYTGRAEELAHNADLRESFDVVLSRAVAKLPTLAELMLPFCRLGGLAIAHKGVGIDEEIREAQRAIEVMGGAIKEIREVGLEAWGETDVRTSLVVLEKRSPTPARYPRRPGIPTKRPL